MNSRSTLAKTSVEALKCKNSAVNSNGPRPIDKRQTPLLNRFYGSRVQMIHLIVSKTIESLDNAAQLLILGAGLDCSFDSLCDRVYAVDLPAVIKERNLKHDCQSINISADLQDVISLEDNLSKNQFDFSRPTIVLIEVVLCYLKPQYSSELLIFLKNKICSSAVITLDPLIRNGCGYDASVFNFSSFLKYGFNKKGAPLLTTFNSLDNQYNFLRSIGWKHINCFTMKQACILFPGETEELKNDTKIFDEFASLAILQSSYVFSIFSNDTDLFSYTFNLLYSNKKNGDEKESEILKRLELRFLMAEKKITYLEEKLKNDSKSDIKIREATLEDIPTILNLYKSAFSVEAERFSSVDKYVRSALKQLRKLNRETLNKKVNLWVADSQETIVGLVGLKEKNEIIENGANSSEHKWNYEISFFCVDPEYRRKGIGRSLIQTALRSKDEIKQEKNIFNLTVLQDLTAARNLYESVGFTTSRITDLGNGCVLIYMTT